MSTAPAFELMPGVTAVELARRRFPAVVLLARRTPQNVSGVECCAVDIAVLHGWPLWLPGLSWQAIAQGLECRDLDVPDPGSDGVCQTRQIVKRGAAYRLQRWVTYCHLLHPLGQVLEVPQPGQRLVFDASFCRVVAGEIEITNGPAKLTGRHCPHLWLHLNQPIT